MEEREEQSKQEMVKMKSDFTDVIHQIIAKQESVDNTLSQLVQVLQAQHSQHTMPMSVVEVPLTRSMVTKTSISPIAEVDSPSGDDDNNDEVHDSTGSNRGPRGNNNNNNSNDDATPPERMSGPPGGDDGDDDDDDENNK